MRPQRMTAEQCAKVSAGGRQTMRAVASHSLTEGVARGSMAGREGRLIWVDCLKCFVFSIEGIRVKLTLLAVFSFETGMMARALSWLLALQQYNVPLCPLGANRRSPVPR